ncbi:hypothetical protein H9Q72_009960 [Fusarium xylarioides]|uniref:Zn(2)-C6 fungal-type domain-containing protein n=1 Tax=Fusarium xylarioides TaxID=221167 RepID=A0A9P7HU30_9HYPO|nr:hypothetical protein H9Q70_003810 [Fusarium xylarioides]KAG5761931.1 hypothetical protein H9Q72_009960 [Fusarium xylarioides]KAG5783093.1 hypothetical protein H9Q73_003285 [Fusarium xylarioides]
MPLPSRGSSTPKISKACVPCRTRKIKCNAAVVGLPCGSCVSRECPDECVLSARKRRAVKGRNAETPRSRKNIPNTNGSVLSLDDVDNEYLAKKKVFELPPPRFMDDIVKAYFDYVYPFAPILNRTDFIQSYRSGSCYLFLLHAVAAAASLYVTHDVLIGCGYADRSTAQASFFSKAKLFHDFHCQGDPLSMLQGSIILGAVILDHPSYRDFQYWFHNSVWRALKMGV